VKPSIERFRFGSITIEGRVFKHDVVIRLDGEVEERDKDLSRDLFGTSHLVSRAEAREVYQQGARRLIVGSGLFGRVKLSAEAAEFFEEKGCQVELLRTRKAARAWNRAEGPVIALFHVSC
jgi:hypothetical protein